MAELIGAIGSGGGGPIGFEPVAVNLVSVYIDGEFVLVGDYKFAADAAMDLAKLIQTAAAKVAS